MRRLYSLTVMLKKLYQRAVAYFQPKTPEPPPPQPVRRTVDTETIRLRLTSQGWRIIERPIKKSDPDPAKRLVVRWRLVALKGDKSLEISGSTIDDAMRNLGQTLGVVSKESPTNGSGNGSGQAPGLVRHG